MSEYDDLFNKNYDLDEKFTNEPVSLDKTANDFFEQREKDKKNGILLALYILANILVSFIGGVYISAEYSYLKEAVNAVEEIIPLTYIVSEAANDTFDIHLSGEFKNNFDRTIPVFKVEVEFYDQDNIYVGLYTLSIDDFKPQDVYSIDESLNGVDFEPLKIEYSQVADIPSILYISLSLIQVIVASILFIVIDKLNFKKDWEDFKQNKSLRMTNIFSGFLMVYAALIAANLILTVLGQTGTSENEMLISSLFNDSPLQLFLLFLLLTVFTPIVEEVIFRKVLFGFIEPRTNYKVAIFISGIVFGIMHVITYGDFVQSIPYIFMGLVFGYIYWKSNKNIYVVIIVHFINNFISWLLYVLMIYGIANI